MGQPPGHQTACSCTGTPVAELCAPPAEPRCGSRSPRVPRASAAPSRLLPSLVGPHRAAKCAVKHPHHRPVHVVPKPALGQGELWARGACLRPPLQQGWARGGIAARDPSLAATRGSPAAGRPPRAGSRAASTGGSWRKARGKAALWERLGTGSGVRLSHPSHRGSYGGCWGGGAGGSLAGPL